jgi:RHS repeat-associated protein
MTFDCAFVDGDCAVHAQQTTTIRGLDGKVLRIYNQPFGGAWNWERDYVYRDGQLLASVEPRSDGGEDTVHFHLDHLGSPRQITTESGAQAAFHTYYPFGGEATDAAQDDVELKFTGHERDSNGGGAGVLDYMHARYCSPVMGRFLAVDPRNSTNLQHPQSWNRYSYALNNPIAYIDPDGETPWRFLIKGARGLYELAKRSRAVRTAARGDDVIAPSQRAAKRLAEEAYGKGNVTRHTAHQPGYRDHFQPARRRGAQRTGHVFYGNPKGVLLAVAGLGAAVANEVEAATGSELAGTAVGLGVDFFNPAADIVELEELLEEIGVDIIEEIYDVDLEAEEDWEFYFSYDPVASDDAQ